MGILNLFSSSSKIYPEKFKQVLHRISVLDRAEREYVKKVFQQYYSGGISKFEVEKAVREMKLNTHDNIEKTEADAIKRELLKYL
jgi:hypothetical protein